MHILVTGASGFIGTQIVGRLLSQGYEVSACVRNPDKLRNQFPQLSIIRCDFTQDTNISDWRQRLNNIDVVVNCVGVLQSRSLTDIEAVHFGAPKALFEACQERQLKKIIHLSAMGAEAHIDTPYSQTKYKLERFIESLSIPWIILKPSLIYGSGSFGGTSLFRALSAFPFVIPMVGKGDTLFQPIHITDMAKTVEAVIEKPTLTHQTLLVVGPKTIALKELLSLLRSWLGYSPVKTLGIPLGLIKPFAWLGNFFTQSPINTTSYRLLTHDFIAPVEPFIQAVGLDPKPIEETLIEQPSSTQDRWHARLYFLNPLLRFTLGIMWLLSGLIPLLLGKTIFEPVLTQFHLPSTVNSLLFYTGSILDIFLGGALLLSWRVKWIASIQAILILSYTIFLSIFMPLLWTDLFGTLLKNIPLLVATLMLITLSDPR